MPVSEKLLNPPWLKNLGLIWNASGWSGEPPTWKSWAWSESEPPPPVTPENPLRVPSSLQAASVDSRDREVAAAEDFDRAGSAVGIAAADPCDDAA